MDIGRIEGAHPQRLPAAPGGQKEEGPGPPQGDSVQLSPSPRAEPASLPITLDVGGKTVEKTIKGIVNDHELVLEIKHTNDIHGNMASTATYIKPDDFWVDAGDAWQDYTFNSVLAGGQREVDIMNRRDCDIATTGNHFYDDEGLQGGQKLIESSQFPYVSTNTEGMVPYLTAEVEGAKIAFIGVRTPQKKFLMVDPSRVKDLELTDPVEAVKKAVEEVTSKGIRNIVVLSHLGLEPSPEFHENTPTDKDLAAKVPGIDLIIGGHSHTPTPEKLEINGATIVQAGIGAHSDVKTDDLYLGELKLHIDRASQKIVSVEHRLIPVDRNITPDSDIQAIIDRYRRNEEEALSRKIGTMGRVMTHELKTATDSPLGNLITDAMRKRTGADVAVLDSSFFSDRKDAAPAVLPKGEITMKSLVALSPWMGKSLDARVETWDVKGSDIRRLLEEGVSKLLGSKKDQGLYQVSGLAMAYVPKNAEGSRVTEVSIGGKPMDPDKSYRLTTTYIVGNWNPLFAGRDESTVTDGPRLRLLVADHLKQAGVIKGPEGGRIRQA
ncbi:MAG: bifunctional UDP-sugar hydrolase/5'-nucleotidase [Candidatus Eremiobacteraeota bacterium]|nr:bifunctional UDP-sugar hydrolase/5'-nucleotidase [Candidatus Eremiobacteraeota bacterium]